MKKIMLFSLVALTVVSCNKQSNQCIKCTSEIHYDTTLPTGVVRSTVSAGVDRMVCDTTKYAAEVAGTYLIESDFDAGTRIEKKNVTHCQ